jgi:hypothetical protein
MADQAARVFSPICQPSASVPNAMSVPVARRRGGIERRQIDRLADQAAVDADDPPVARCRGRGPAENAGKAHGQRRRQIAVERQHARGGGLGDDRGMVGDERIVELDQHVQRVVAHDEAGGLGVEIGQILPDVRAGAQAPRQRRIDQPVGIDEQLDRAGDPAIPGSGRCRSSPSPWTPVPRQDAEADRAPGELGDVGPGRPQLGRGEAAAPAFGQRQDRHGIAVRPAALRLHRAPGDGGILGCERLGLAAGDHRLVEPAGAGQHQAMQRQVDGARVGHRDQRAGRDQRVVVFAARDRARG